MLRIKYYIFCIKWLWKNINWDNTRQKFKAMEKKYNQINNKIVDNDELYSEDLFLVKELEKNRYVDKLE